MSYTIIQPNDVRFTLIYNDEPHIIDLSPDKWSDHEFSNKRDLSFWGVLRNYATDVEFVGSAADLIRSVFFTDGVDGLITLKIETLNRSTWQYQTIYTGDLDLSTFEDHNHRVTCNIIEGGLSAFIQARKNVRFDIEFDDDDPTIDIGSVDVPSFVTLNFYGSTGSQSTVPFNMIGMRSRIGISSSSDSFKTVRVREYDESFLTPTVFTDAFGPTFNEWVFYNELGPTVTANISGYLNMNLQYMDNDTKVAGYTAQIIGRNTETGAEDDVRYLLFTTNEASSSTAPPFVVVKRFDFNFIATFKAGYMYTIVFYINSPIVQLRGRGRILVEEGSMTVKWDTPMQSTHRIKAKHPKKIFGDIVKKINDNNDAAVVSDLLDDNFNLLITSGDAIRQLSNAQIKTSFDDFYKSINSVLNCGFGFDENKNPIIEAKSHFFKKDQDIIDFGDVTNVKINPLTQVMISSILAGYSSQDYEIEKGVDEFNQGQEYTIDQTRVQNKLDLKSIYRADQYGIDTVRIKEINKAINATDTDANTDNDVWFILCKKTPNSSGDFEPIGKGDAFFIQLNGSTTITRTKFFNYLLSPKNNLFRHLDFIKSTIFGNNKGLIDFQSADRNVDLITIADSSSATPAIYEKASIDMNEYEIERLFYPIIIEFETAIKPNLQTIIEMQSNGVCSFNFRGHKFNGFIFSIDLNANRGSSSVVQLILSPDNDLNLLI